jgi:hypothetical protein
MKYGVRMRPCEHDIEPSGRIQVGEFLDQLRDYQVRKRALLQEVS